MNQKDKYNIFYTMNFVKRANLGQYSCPYAHFYLSDNFSVLMWDHLLLYGEKQEGNNVIPCIYNTTTRFQ